MAASLLRVIDLFSVTNTFRNILQGIAAPTPTPAPGPVGAGGGGGGGRTLVQSTTNGCDTNPTVAGGAGGAADDSDADGDPGEAGFDDDIVAAFC